jgi:putative aldouronate transport system permease protein
MQLPLRRADHQARTRRRPINQLRKHWQLFALLFLPLLYLAIFQYWPMYGVQIAFRNFNAIDGILGSPWVGLRHFQRFIGTYDFVETLRNTIVLSLYSIVVGFPFPIMLALGLNYVTHEWFRRTVQMVTFAPYFISVVVMAGIILQFLAPNTGLVNHILVRIGLPQVNFLGRPELFAHVYVWSGLWQTIGFSSVLYIATLTSVDPTLHEAAIVDGASKLQRIWHIDLPELMPLATLLLVLNMGGLLSSGFEKILLLQNPLNLRASEVIDTYVYRVGLVSTFPDYSYAAAIGLFKSVVGLILLLLVDRFAKRLGQPGAL